MKNGVSLEEASEDLNLSVIQLENIEDGNIRAFKDVYVLRNLVKDYAKYLGVETDEIMDEFNDFMFEHTSKISFEDIKEARRLAQQERATEDEKPRVISPYTNIKIPKFRLERLKVKPIIVLIMVLLLFTIGIFIWFYMYDKEDVVSSELMGRNGDVVYEFTY